MAIAYTDFLQQVVAGVIVPWQNVFVRLVSNNTGTAYISDAATSSLGKFTYATKPPGDSYTVYTGPSNTGPWTATGAASYAVPVVAGENPTFQSLTDLASGPFSPNLPGASSTPTPAGIGTGPFWDYGGEVFNVKAFAAKGDGQYVTDVSMSNGSGIVTSASALFKSTDVGKLAFVQFAGAASITVPTTIASYQSATQVTLAATNASGGNLTNAFMMWMTDDTTAFTNWLNRIKTAPGSRGIIPPGHYGVNGALPSIATPCDIIGSGCTEGFGSLAANPNSVNYPSVPPYLNQCVIWQFATATDVLKLTGAGTTVNLKDFGIAFASLFNNTGHGINVVPPADGGNFDMGPAGSIWDSVKVFGHDGNHYGFRIYNTFYNTFRHMRSYGGGGLFMRGDTTRTQYGNDTFDHLYVVVIVSGSSHGIRLEGNGAGRLNLIAMVRPQSWIYAPATPIPGTSPPTNAQSSFSQDGNVTGLDLFGPDLENNVSGSSNPSGVYAAIRTVGGWGASLDGLVTAAGFAPNLVSENALVLEGNSSTQNADLMRVLQFHGGNQVFGIKGHVFGDGTYFYRSSESPAFASTYTPDCGNAHSKYMTLTGAITVNAPSTTGGPQKGMHLRFFWQQDATGGRVVTYNAIYKTGGAPAFVTTLSTVTIDEFEYDGAAWRIVSRITGQAV